MAVGGDMKLFADPSLKLVVGDFRAQVTDQGLLLPTTLFRRLEIANVHTAEQFVALCQSTSLSLAMMLDWSIECVEPALQKLTKTLEGHVSPSILHPGPPVAYKDDGCTMTDEERDLLNEINKAN